MGKEDLEYLEELKKKNMEIKKRKQTGKLERTKNKKHSIQSTTWSRASRSSTFGEKKRVKRDNNSYTKNNNN